MAVSRRKKEKEALAREAKFTVCENCAFATLNTSDIGFDGTPITVICSKDRLWHIKTNQKCGHFEYKQAR